MEAEMEGRALHLVNEDMINKSYRAGTSRQMGSTSRCFAHPIPCAPTWQASGGLARSLARRCVSGAEYARCTALAGRRSRRAAPPPKRTFTSAPPTSKVRATPLRGGSRVRIRVALLPPIPTRALGAMLGVVVPLNVNSLCVVGMRS